MDKDRRRRIRAVLKNYDKEGLTTLLSGTAVAYVNSLIKDLQVAKIDIAASVIKDVRAAAGKIDSFMVCTQDALITSALYHCWGLDGDKKACGKSDKKCKGKKD